MAIEMKHIGGKYKPTSPLIRTKFGRVKVVGIAQNLFGGWTVWLKKKPKPSNKEEATEYTDLPF